ncbi:MAG TPA: hypothetical protein VII78_00590, partial [Myxococcota bacterium]
MLESKDKHRARIAGTLAAIALFIAGPSLAATVNFSTYLGSTGPDWVRDVVYDAAGNLYAVGGSRSSNLPTTPGTAQPVFGGYEDAFVAKFSPKGKLLWATYLGGVELDRAYAVELDGNGDVVIAGRAGASFPVTAGAVQTQFKGGATSGTIYPHPQDGFVAKLRGSNGKKLWATFFGATDGHFAIVRDIAVDPVSGWIYLAASTDTGTYPSAVLSAFQRGNRKTRFGGTDGVLAQLSGDGRSLGWATYVGGSGEENPTPSVRLDAQGNPIILFASTSSDAKTTRGAFNRFFGGVSDFYLAKFAINGPLLWATFVGGSQAERVETHNLAIRTDGSIVIAGATTSTNFPTVAGAYDRSWNSTNGAADCGIAVLSPAGSALLAGTYYGGKLGDNCEGVGSDSQGNIYVSGGTASLDLPLLGAIQTKLPSSPSPFVAVFGKDLAKLRFATYFG